MEQLKQRLATAKKILKQRWNNETQAQRLVENEIKRTFLELLDMGYAENVSGLMFQFSKMKNKDELNRLLTDLRLYIYMTETHAVEENNRIIHRTYGTPVAWNVDETVNREIDGRTNKQRIAKYTNRLKFEFETWIAAGIAFSLSKKKIEEAYIKYRLKPFSNPIFNKAVNSKAMATRLRHGGVSYGVGQYVSAEASITRLVRASIEDAYRMAQLSAWGRQPIAYYVFRGSSYPCQTCDDMQGLRTLAIDLPPYHPNCCCGAIPIYDGDNTAELF